MSEERKETKQKTAAAFYRRCHVCDSVTGAEAPVLQCESCGKEMAPFFYFDVRKSRVYADQPFDNLEEDGKYRPIEGLTAFW